MAENETPTTDEKPATDAPVTEKKVEKAAEAQSGPDTDTSGSAIANTPSEAAANQSAAQGDQTPPPPGSSGAPAGAPASTPPQTGRGPQRGGRGGGGGRGDNRGGGRGRGGPGGHRGGRDEPDDGIMEKLVHINRVSKTVKGGKRFGFAALVVVGDGSGRVGFGKGKAREVPEAITKATAAARKHMVRVSLKEGRTLHHDCNGRFGAGKVTVRTAPAGTGIIAGGPMRAVFESLGVADVVTKSVGTSNPYNMIRATFDALTSQTSPKSVAQRRGKKVADLLGRGGSSDSEAQADAAAVTE